MIKLFNSLSNDNQPLAVGEDSIVRIYSCGPTVYNRVHIGNLSSFIYADMLHRTVKSSDLKLEHTMNLTDIDDKTIKTSQPFITEKNGDAMAALEEVTTKYTSLFMADFKEVGNDDDYNFIQATDPKIIEKIQDLIKELLAKKIAYRADDGIYFSLEQYKKAGGVYGKLIKLEPSNATKARINNDEYDKESANDFALWKLKKDDEPAWNFDLDGQNLAGRPGWHIECSAICDWAFDSRPLSVHTGGIDLRFPHHENEIAQTFGAKGQELARSFVHSAHILIEGKKMSKSANNFFTLENLKERGFGALDLRMLVLQSHYQNSVNFSWDNLEAASKRLKRWRKIACLRHQTYKKEEDQNTPVPSYAVNRAILTEAQNNLNTPEVLKIIDSTFNQISTTSIEKINRSALNELILFIDDLLGLHLAEATPDIPSEAKQKIIARLTARQNKNWEVGDQMRDELGENYNLEIDDQTSSTTWSYKD